MAVAAKVLLPYDWSWNFSFLFSSILAATDTVAVVSLLHSAGASPKLTMIIVGESLANDGTGMVLFTLFLTLCQGTTYTIGEIILFFLKTICCSVLLGVGIGLVCVRWLRTANRPLKETDTITQIAVTLVCAYLTFFIGQYMFEISGVLATVGAGLMFAWLAPPIILNKESMHNFWSMIEWIGNTLIFLLAGLIIGHRVLGHVNNIDWLYCFVLYLLLNIIRFIVVAVFHPVISRIGHKCTSNEAVFISFGGLRGALGMALALVVENADKSDTLPSAEASRVFFYVGGIAALYLLINATTATWVLDKLGLVNTDSIEKELVIGQIKKRLKRKVNKIVDDLEKQLKLSPEDTMDVRMSCSLLRDLDLEDLYRDTEFDQSRASGLFRSVFSGLTKEQKKVDDLQIRDSVGGNGNQSGSVSQSTTSGGAIIEKMRQSTSRQSRNNSTSRTRLVSESRAARLSTVSRMLSMSTRGGHGAIIPALLAYVRTIFLEIVRVKYWNLIEAGKLPRQSHSASFLLYSVDVGLDDVTDATMGLKDWNVSTSKLICAF